MEIGGITPGLDYDVLSISGSAALDGALHVTLLDGFTPVVGNSFTLIEFGESALRGGAVMSGSFNCLSGLQLPDSVYLKPVELPKRLLLIAVDSVSTNSPPVAQPDTGATDSLAPADELEKIGVRKQGKMSRELADGTVKEYPFGLVRIEFMGETTAGRVIFGDPGCEPILGVTALESVGIVVDPASKTLKRLPAIPLK